jgi:hypothetical protein
MALRGDDGLDALKELMQFMVRIQGMRRRFPKCACDGAMTQPIGSGPYRAGAQIAADKTAVLMGSQVRRRR